LLHATTFAILTMLPAVCLAQQTPPFAPTAPAATPSLDPPAAPLASVAGAITYSDGSVAEGVAVTLTAANGTTLQATTGADGSFLILTVPPGAFTISVHTEGFQPDSVTGTATPGSTTQLAPIALRVARLVTTVNAISQQQEAELEVRAEEQQRILGAIPNFFVSYTPHPVPLSAGQKFHLSFRTLIDPATIGVAAAIAAGQQADNSYPGFGQGAAGYFRRFGASYGGSVTGIMLGGAILPSIFHQDPRYFYQGSGSTLSRAGSVLKQTFEQRGDNGNWQFAWSNTLGGVGSALISNTYYPNQKDKWATLTGENLGLSILGNAISNALEEFVFNRITTHRQP
jgi:hypothetical protein